MIFPPHKVAGGSASATGFTFAPMVFGNDVAVATTAASTKSSAEEDAQPEVPPPHSNCGTFHRHSIVPSPSFAELRLNVMLSTLSSYQQTAAQIKQIQYHAIRAAIALIFPAHSILTVLSPERLLALHAAAPALEDCLQPVRLSSASAKLFTGGRIVVHRATNSVFTCTYRRRRARTFNLVFLCVRAWRKRTGQHATCWGV